jgi:hypothetical protein
LINCRTKIGGREALLETEEQGNSDNKKTTKGWKEYRNRKEENARAENTYTKCAVLDMRGLQQ